MATIRKDKNYIVFTNNENRTYKFDMSNGVFYSTKGNPMKTTPSGFATCIKTYRTNITLAYMVRQHEWRSVPYNNMAQFTKYLLICDKLNSIGYEYKRYYELENELLDFVNENFKAFAKALRENEDLTMEDFRRTYGKTKYFADMGLKVDDYYTQTILDLIWEWREHFTKKESKLVAYYLSRGVYEFCTSVDRYDRVDHRMFVEFFKWCSVIEHTPTKDDFFHQYLMVKKNYYMNKKKYDNKSIVMQLEKHSNIWEFENEDFCIVIPKSVDDFKAEADAQNNCVYTMYMSKVISGSTNVVFVRRKSDPTKSFITCEVNNSGRICQYLKKHNQRVDCGTKEYDFKMALENFIAENWCE